jgi:hypothetical protein
VANQNYFYINILDCHASLATTILLGSAEVERLWLNEAEFRLDAYRSGQVQGIPADEVFHRAISELS